MIVEPREAGDSARDYKTSIVMIRLSPNPRALIIFFNCVPWGSAAAALHPRLYADTRFAG